MCIRDSHTLAMRITSVGHVGIKAANRFYLDYNSIGNGDTYIDEYSANEVGITTGGSRKIAISGGNLYCAGSLNANHNFSDERLKENVKVIDNALDKLDQLRGVTFDWIDRDDKRSGGIIAQELEKVMPELVKEVDSLKSPFGSEVISEVDTKKISETQDALNEKLKFVLSSKSF